MLQGKTPGELLEVAQDAANKPRYDATALKERAFKFEADYVAEMRCRQKEIDELSNSCVNRLLLFLPGK